MPARFFPVLVPVVDENLFTRANWPQRHANDAQLAIVVNRLQLGRRRLAVVEQARDGAHRLRGDHDGRVHDRQAVDVVVAVEARRRRIHEHAARVLANRSVRLSTQTLEVSNVMKLRRYLQPLSNDRMILAFEESSIFN